MQPSVLIRPVHLETSTLTATLPSFQSSSDCNAFVQGVLRDYDRRMGVGPYCVDDKAGQKIVGDTLSIYTKRGDTDARDRALGLLASKPQILQLPFPSADSEGCFEFLKQHLDDCLRNHERCRKTLGGEQVDAASHPILPTRIIDVSPADGGSVRLVEQQQPSSPEESPLLRGRYVALSHCWGPPDSSRPPLTTTSATLRQHRRRIPLDGLSQTFRDAIRITRALGLRYLWIDSLCILQDADDKADWAREAPKMGTVYEQAHLTISASGAADGAGGCFIPRETLGAVAIPMTSAEQAEEEAGRQQVFLGRNAATTTTTTTPHSQLRRTWLGPLQNRAWITQEWILSPRVIHYSADALVWMCSTTIAAEDARPCDLDAIRGRSFDDLKHRYDAHRCPARRDIRAEQIRGNWHGIVAEYSARQLTHVGDKLVALQGLIGKVEE
ncbi:putative heterokaryon incompatibility protein [Diplodia seriata]|uniref:Putative heterokaryon incompatibility protein n=1 Tax=Diplodia seriata TaxID=420778 RepID=A0A0G2GEI4_9PEZI|nr:putative heterokaryon incompatibility protein [Diplodia seriata]